MDVETGDPIDPEKLERAANRLHGLRLFERVGYRLIGEGGETGVEFDVRSKSWGPNFLRFGVSLEEGFDGSTAFNLSTRWRRPELNDLGAELLTDLQLGTDPLFVSEFYQPLRFDSRVFVAPALILQTSNRNAFIMDDAAARFRFTEAIGQIDVGAEIGTAGEFRVGLYRGVGEARVKIGDPSIPDFDFDSGGMLTRLRFDTFDNAQFPREGLRSSLTWDSSRTNLGADFRFDTMEFNFDAAVSRGKSTIVGGINYATTLDSNSPMQNFFPLGGFLRLSGLERGQVSGPHYGLARLVYYRRIGDSSSSLLQMPIYLGASIEAGNVWQDRDAIGLESLRTNGSLFFGLNTPLGPFYLAAGFGEQGRTNFYLFIGATPR
jgi:NTE family protein